MVAKVCNEDDVELHLPGRLQGDVEADSPHEQAI